VFVLIGFVIVFGSILLGFSIHGGKIAVLMQVSEFIIIGGAGLGAIVIGNKPSVVVSMFKQVFGLLKPNPYNRAAYAELLQVLYEVFYLARKDGLVGIEPHVEDPERSDLFARYPTFHRNEQAVAFLSDTMKVLLTGAVDDHHLAEILDLDLEKRHEAAMVVPRALARLADAMPGFGIVAAVLGVVITMGHIGGAASEVGQSIAGSAGRHVPRRTPGVRGAEPAVPGRGGAGAERAGVPGVHPDGVALLLPWRPAAHVRGIRAPQHRAG